jgi:hypothetical protein
MQIGEVTLIAPHSVKEAQAGLVPRADSPAVPNRDYKANTLDTDQEVPSFVTRHKWFQEYLVERSNF